MTRPLHACHRPIAVRSARTVLAMAGAALLAVSLGAATASHAKPPVAEGCAEAAGGIAGPEGIAFTRHDGYVVGTTTGDIIRVDRNGVQTVLANVGEGLAGISVLRDGTVLAAALGPGRVWAVDENGNASIFSSGIGGPNFVVQTRKN